MPIQEQVNETNEGKKRRKRVNAVDLSAESAKATKASPNNPSDQDDEQEVEESLKFSGPPDLDALRTTGDTADEDVLRTVGPGPSKSAQGVMVSDAKPSKRRVARAGSKRGASNATATGLGPEALLASKWLSSAQVKQLEKDTGACRML